MTALASASPSSTATFARLRGWWVDSPRRMDAVVSSSLLAIAALTVTGPGVVLTPMGQAVAALASIAQAAALLGRRKAPVAVLVVAVVALVGTVSITGDPVASEVGVAFAVYAIAAQRSPMVAWAAWAATMAVSWLSYVLALRAPSAPPVPTYAQALLTAVLGLLLVSLVALALGLTVGGRRVQVAALEERARRLALERDQRAQLAAAAERARMAREMHDVVAHSVAVMVTLAHGAAASIDRHPDQAREALSELGSTGRAALTDMRGIVGLLRDDRRPSGAPGEPAPEDLSVAALVETFQQAGLPVRLVERGPTLPHDPRLRLAVFRVVQECLTNVLRHAPHAPHAVVSLDRSEHDVTVTVENGRGGAAPDSSGGGHGLAGIRERVAAHHGTVEAGPTPTGWRVCATLRYTEQAP